MRSPCFRSLIAICKILAFLIKEFVSFILTQLGQLLPCKRLFGVCEKTPYVLQIISILFDFQYNLTKNNHNYVFLMLFK
jgi:hypothetical protein